MSFCDGELELNRQRRAVDAEMEGRRVFNICVKRSDVDGSAGTQATDSFRLDLPSRLSWEL